MLGDGWEARGRSVGGMDSTRAGAPVASSLEAVRVSISGGSFSHRGGTLASVPGLVMGRGDEEGCALLVRK